MQSKIFLVHFLTHFSTDQDEILCGVKAIQAERSYTVKYMEWDSCSHRKFNSVQFNKPLLFLGRSVFAASEIFTK